MEELLNYFNCEEGGPVTPLEIKAAIILKGVSQTSIAKELGIAKSLVSMVIHGTEKNAKVRKAIAKIMGQPVKKIWPK
ncbi:MAG TPA: transcriptional regulator [Firmicutes bacterium]|jgi:lambda repressor-like predicted transcriptional regulator|nr:transcriptional regulator [Bacillota bacterium]